MSFKTTLSYLQLVYRTHFPFPKQIRQNCFRASIGKISRESYLRLYPTIVANPDGSTYILRHKIPREIIQLPLDVNTLDEEQRRERLSLRKPKVDRGSHFEKIDDNFNIGEYSYMFSNKKSKSKRTIMPKFDSENLLKPAKELPPRPEMPRKKKEN